MAYTTQIQSNFTSGELSPRLYSHVDVVKYKNGLKTLLNARILPHGPFRYRNGSKFIAEVKDSSKTTRIINFQFDQTFAYILELGDLYIRFYRNKAQVVSGGNPYEIVSPYTQSEINDITYTQFGRDIYLFHPSHPIQKLSWTSDTSWKISDVQFSPPPTYENGYQHASATITPGATTGTGITFTASTGYLRGGYVGRQILHVDADGKYDGLGKAVVTSFTDVTHVVCTILDAFQNTNPIPAGSYKFDLSPISKLTIDGVSLGSIVTVDADTGTFQSTDVGNYILIHNGVLKITSYTSEIKVKALVVKGPDDIAQTGAWSLETPIWNSTNGYPAVGALYQQRLLAGNTSYSPQTIWGSETGIFTSMGPGAGDSDGIQFDITAQAVSKVTWMMGVRGQLAVGSTSAEFTISADTATGPVTPKNINPQLRGYEGSNIQQPLGLNDEVIYAHRSGMKLNALRYNFQIDNYESEDLLFLAEHLAVNGEGIKGLAYAHAPDRSLYVVLNNGDLLAGVYFRSQEVLGWSKYTTDGEYESISTISTGSQDEVWLLVKRTINNQTKRYIEVFDSSNGDSDLDGFSDSYLTYNVPKTITSITAANPIVITSNSHGLSNGDHIKVIEINGMDELIGKTYVVTSSAANTFSLEDLLGDPIDSSDFTPYVSGGEVHKLVSTISGLEHLEGKSVQVKIDGSVMAPDPVVTSGEITLTYPSYHVTVGLPYEMRAVTLDKEFSIGFGSQQGQPCSWVRPILRVYNSAIPRVNGQLLPSRNASMFMDNKVSLYSGDLYYSNLKWNNSSSLTITHSLPLPCVILGFFGSIESGAQ
jgi:hypothetical protein